MQRALVLIEVLHEFSNATAVLELSVFGLARLAVSCSLIRERDRQAFIEKREFAEALCERVIVVFNGRENIVIR